MQIIYRGLLERLRLRFSLERLLDRDPDFLSSSFAADRLTEDFFSWLEEGEPDLDFATEFDFFWDPDFDFERVTDRSFFFAAAGDWERDFCFDLFADLERDPESDPSCPASSSFFEDAERPAEDFFGEGDLEVISTSLSTNKK